MGDKSAINTAIQSGAPSLKHVEPVHDASAPKIDANTHVKQVDRSPFLKEVAADHGLKHVEPTHDASAPKIDANTHVKQVDRSGFLDSVAKGADLKHVDK